MVKRFALALIVLCAVAPSALAHATTPPPPDPQPCGAGHTTWVRESSSSWQDAAGDRLSQSIWGLRDISTNQYCNEVYSSGTFTQVSPQCRIGYGQQLLLSGVNNWQADRNFVGCNTEIEQLASPSFIVTVGRNVQANAYVGNRVWDNAVGWLTA